MAAVIIIIFLVGTVIFKFGFVNPAGLAAIAGLMVAAFSMIGWLYWPIGVLMIIVLVLMFARGISE
jgi:hypothetical protein